MKEIRKYQLQELEILREFRKFCDQFHLRYYLTAGTLLGAVRHQGFIPWDDDIDIAMPRRDYNMLQKLAGKIPAGYFLQCAQTEPNFPYYFSKMRKDHTTVSEPILETIPMHQGIYIDIFPLDYCPDNDKIAMYFFKAIELFGTAILSRVSQDFTCGYEKVYMRLLEMVLSKFPNKTLHFLREQTRRIFSLFSSGKRLCTVGGHHGFPRESYCAEWFRNTVFIQFEEEDYPVPAGWMEILKNMYGDYMTPPEENQRRGHF